MDSWFPEAEHMYTASSRDPMDNIRNSLGILRAVALIAALAGALGSVGLVFQVGRRNPSRVLLIMFALWVLSPFAALVWAEMVSKGWQVLTRVTVYGLMVVVAVGSLAIYGEVAFGPPRPQPAFWFLVVPAASWILGAIVVSIALQMSKRQARRS